MLTPDTRPSWDEYFFSVAELVATRSTCPRRHVGAILVRDKRIIATGYNGSVAGEPHCDDPDYGCLMLDGHCERTIHAEANAVLQCAKYGILAQGSVLYCTVNPCRKCKGILGSAGIADILTRENTYEARWKDVR